LKTAQQLIGTALDGTGWTWREIVSGIARGEFHLFQNETAALIGEFIVSPRHRVLHIWLGGGDMAGVEALIDEAEAFGRRNGCDAGGATGRKGWVRALRKYGYRPAMSAVEKEL
jgi:hypothetical protein